MFERIGQMIVKEFIQTLRDRRMRYFLVGPPLIQLMIFGYVVTTDVTNVRMAYYDLDRSSTSRELARRFEASEYFQILYRPESPGEIKDLLDTGRVICAVQVNRGFEKDVLKGAPAEVQVILDGTDSNTALIAMGYVNGIIAKMSQDVSTGPGKVTPSPPGLDIQTRAWYNPDLRSRNYNVPGVIASIIMLIGLMLTAMAIVREREIGTMEQLMVTPIRPFELICGKTAPFAIIGYFNMTLVTVAGVFWFAIPIKGSIGLLVLSTGIYLLSVLGIGLFISTVSRTQQQAMMAAMLFFMPALLLSGFVFPIENMPPVFQYLTYANPLRYFLVIIRGIFLKGAGVAVLWPQMVSLLALGSAILTLSAARFRKRLE